MSRTKKTILVVDDEPVFAEMIKMRLEAANFAVELAHNGEDALKRAAVLKPALILLDVMMPGMDGFEVLKKLRTQPDLCNTPVVMLTARGESKAIFRAQDLAVADYLIKPCEAKELLSAVRRNAR